MNDAQREMARELRRRDLERDPLCGKPTKTTGRTCLNRARYCKLHRDVTPEGKPGERLLEVMDRMDEQDQIQLLAAISDLIEPARKAIKRGDMEKALEILDPLVFHLSGSANAS